MPTPAPSRPSSWGARVRRQATWGAVLRLAIVVAVGVAGGMVALLVAGTRTEQVGPLIVRTQVLPSLTGDTVLHLPPLGSVTLDSHDGPIALHATVREVDVLAAGSLFEGRGAAVVQAQIEEDARKLLVRTAIQAMVVAATGAALAMLAVWRSPELALAAFATAVGGFVLVAALGAVTWNDRALAQPRYSGVLVYAPRVVGSADEVVGNLERYGAQLARLVDNVSKLSAAALALPTFEPDPETVRVLHVSDIHLNPNVWPIMRAIVEQYDVNLVIDTGDIADQGTAAESRLLTGIRTIPVPYVFIRGNHDSFVTQTAVADLPNTVVLTGEVEEVEGLRLLGDGDPRFTPDKATEPSAASVVAQGEDLAEVALTTGEPVDVILVHDPSAAPPLAGAVPLVLAGHVHQRRDELLSDNTRILVQGSSGGAGLRALESEKPTPLTFTVLYFDRESRQLQARDEITLGGLGTTTAEVERIIMEPLVEETTP